MTVSTKNITIHINIIQQNLIIIFAAVTLAFEMEQYSTVESNDVTVCVVLSGQSERDVAVRVSTADGVAEGKNYVILVK